MQKIRIVTCFTMSLLFFSSFHNAYARDKQESHAIDLAKEAYQAIKENNSDAITKIVVDERDIKALAQNGIGFAKDLSDEMIKKGVMILRDKSLKSLKRTRAITKQLGLQWNNSNLRKMVTLVKGKETKATKDDPVVDILLVIDFGKETITVKLDDCFYVNGQRKIGDGFRIQSNK